MNLDERLSVLYAKGASTRLARCATRCGLNDSILVEPKSGFRSRQHHTCIEDPQHDGACDFIRTCGKSR